MPKGARPAGTQWAGLNKRVDPVELPPEQSPDCANVFFYDQTMGLLGPRLGKAYAGYSNYTIWGVMPWNVSGQVGALVGYGDAVSSEIGFLTPYDVTYPHGGWGDLSRSGPVVVPPATINRGFAQSMTLAGTSGASPQEEVNAVALNVPVNGATVVIATCPSGDFEYEGTLNTYVKFDAGGWVLANTCIVESGGCGYGLIVTHSPVEVDCTGKTALTGIKCEAVEPGATVTVDGIVYVVGVPI